MQRLSYQPSFPRRHGAYHEWEYSLEYGQVCSVILIPSELYPVVTRTRVQYGWSFYQSKYEDNKVKARWEQSESKVKGMSVSIQNSKQKESGFFLRVVTRSYSYIVLWISLTERTKTDSLFFPSSHLISSNLCKIKHYSNAQDG
jgi:hypothetical protein